MYKTCLRVCNWYYCAVTEILACALLWPIVSTTGHVESWSSQRDCTTFCEKRMPRHSWNVLTLSHFAPYISFTTRVQNIYESAIELSIFSGCSVHTNTLFVSGVVLTQSACVWSCFNAIRLCFGEVRKFTRVRYPRPKQPLRSFITDMNIHRHGRGTVLIPYITITSSCADASMHSVYVIFAHVRVLNSVTQSDVITWLADYSCHVTQAVTVLRNIDVPIKVPVEHCARRD